MPKVGVRAAGERLRKLTPDIEQIQVSRESLCDRPTETSFSPLTLDLPSKQVSFKSKCNVYESLRSQMLINFYEFATIKHFLGLQRTPRSKKMNQRRTPYYV